MIVFFILFAAALILALQRLSTLRGLQGLEEDFSTSASAVEPDERFDLVVRLENRTRRFMPFVRFSQRLPEGIAVHAALKNVNRLEGKGSNVFGTTWLRPRQRLLRHIPVSCEKRGRYLIRDLTIYGGDFLGVKEHNRTYTKYCEVVAYPRPLEISSLDSVFGGFLGEVSVNRFLFEDPVLTLGFREYTGREPMKTISWTQSARRGGLMVKNFDHTMEPTVSVAVNTECLAEDRPALLETCYSLARAVCRKLEDKGVKYAFSMNAPLEGSLSVRCDVPEGLGSRHFYGILECLGRASSAPPLISCEELAERALDGSTGARGLILITPERGEAYDGAARRAADRAGCTLMTLCAREVTP